MSQTFCTYIECPKSQDCKMFLEQIGEEILFKNICPLNDYHWFRQSDKAVVVKEDSTEIKEVKGGDDKND